MAADVLIVDDEADIRMLMAGILGDEGYETRDAADSTGALEAIKTRRPSLVILDIWLQGSQLDGLQLLEIVKREHPAMPVLMISGHGNVETAFTAMKLGANDFIEKPFKADHLLLRVQKAIDEARLKRENETLRSKLGNGVELLGASPPMSSVRQAIERVAPTSSRVLITGPAGAGKEVVARLLHERSRRASGPFVALNCATMRPERVEIELFGTESGVEGPGSPATIGTFEQAHGGTLLLDEVSDMPLETQGKMVRVLQEQTFERVGGKTRVSVDVRVIASSNRDLQVEMAEGRFRQDLFYRLCVVPVAVPALADRREDISILARHFVERAVEVNGLPARPIADDAMAILSTYHWPGNVRELRNVVEWLLIMAPGEPHEPIRASMLPPDIGVIPHPTSRGDFDGEIMSVPLREARELFERRYLDAQVTRFDGNIAKTAAFIGMERSALYRKLRALGIAPSDRSPED
jgi:two-component system, NtrC family, nitrogen regulation response regulator NtrX